GGLSFYFGQPLAEGSTLYVMAPQVEAVARVVRTRPHGPVSIVHAQMLSACFRRPTTPPT
ncbi:hypothetical protein ABTB55_18665, partial [Acinetobacter baumannii]